MSIFTDKLSNDSHQDTLLMSESNYTCHCVNEKHSESNNFFIIQNVEIDIDKTNVQPIITIVSNYSGYLEYALSKDFESADFTTEPVFILDNTDANNYYVMIKDEFGIIYVHSKINISIL